MTRLILVKHAMPDIIPDVPARDWLLSDQGRQDCLTLADQLVLYKPDTVITSHEPKASETGRIVANRLHLPVTEADDLHEHDRRQEPYQDAGSFQARVQAFFTRPDNLVYGLETANAAHDRFAEAVDLVLQECTGKTPVIVAHGTVISLYVARQLGIDPYLLWKALLLPSFLVLDDHLLIAHWNTTLES
ncbi:MAG TPA: histidine phosphatase family protein [Phototrophicaceae bacterium]|jgi:broad specificity phosphatase PhoE|nr:histidine phosphatase family protein [Phototrophicaceae bacterium]